MSTVTKRAHEASCRAAQSRFAQLPPREARLALACEVQGFVASEVARGTPLRTAIGKLTELLLMIIEANE